MPRPAPIPTEIQHLIDAQPGRWQTVCVNPGGVHTLAQAKYTRKRQRGWLSALWRAAAINPFAFRQQEPWLRFDRHVLGYYPTPEAAFEAAAIARAHDEHPQRQATLRDIDRVRKELREAAVKKEKLTSPPARPEGAMRCL